MNISVKRDPLLKLLGRAQSVVDKRHSMAVLSNVLLDARDATLTVIATDLEVSLSQTTEAEVVESGSVALSARKIFEIVREAGPEGEIGIHVLDNGRVKLSYGRSEFKLMGVPAADHPGMPAADDGKESVTLELDVTELCEMIRKTIFAVSVDDTRSNLAGVYLESPKDLGILRMVATDGHRLAMIDRETVDGRIEGGIILPRKGLNEAAKLLAEAEGRVKMIVSPNESALKLENWTLSMRLVEGSFPDYRQVVPGKTTNLMVTERDSLLQTVRRVSLLSSERARGIKLNVNDASLEVSANNPDLGEATEDVAVEYDGDEIEIGFNSRYILDVLNVIPEEGKVEIALKDHLSPGVVRCDDSGYTYVVMPMRI
ncbi:MAG: DNA polymerase III subunit beta [Candidatus Binatia bacterium]